MISTNTALNSSFKQAYLQALFHNLYFVPCGQAPTVKTPATQIYEYLENRYGEWILYDPKFNKNKLNQYFYD